MSLVQEALDKIQEKRIKKEDAKHAAARPISAVETPRKSPWPALFVALKGKNLVMALIAAAVIAVAGVALLTYLLSDGTGDASGLKKSKRSKKPVVAQTVTYRPLTPPPDAAIDDAAVRKPYRPIIPRLILNGIMYIEGEPRAIINNMTVFVGDSVSGAVVKDIQESSVTLNTETTEIIINLD